MRIESGCARIAGQKLSESERDYVRNHPKLGMMPDTWLAEKLGVSKFTIARARRRRDIPPYTANAPEQLSDISKYINNWRR